MKKQVNFSMMLDNEKLKLLDVIRNMTQGNKLLRDMKSTGY